ncbi:guanylate kinase [Cryptococcus neoformans]|uniref:guanylate kinase n=2 Tax=Cryptococcus neoformans TaxID=5207 RepID=A0A854QEH7_CRYNE|nr:guanylate kinase [Cryptococcus neoformans var. grubii H99]AUB24490.1 guanylate kinase [Cryptococcus neoformans var. grubii]OWZ32233.1 guanylate kinase [Cryptococcus neoformans var. grubii AD2-60a]OWZ44080.1 guanylate kinase [Cryptococcus neoformans var. grubii C23]OWZ45061.1 guanylate kinase [Cryptococcus neoformans var. grubii AD1-83a]OWZ58397.1 guanylate kinase [Cryptococcus neoformans var. grubii 125.91]OXC61875.1 guanylate kinase [Cryptococcus neoformans var. grubii MW-RSA852]OXC85043|eukprot:XP_012049496.1 guanylate kinase [Cryptococcus neoformans var. grubii H99]
MSRPINPDVVNRPLVICGPSGTGKSTLLKTLFESQPNTFGFSVSHTTRKPRPGEENGREYHFVTKEEFMEGVGKGEFLEWAEFGGNCYGTTFAALTALHPRRCILDIELQGVLQLKAKAPLQTPPLEPVFLFLSPPSISQLKSRLSGRGTETDASIRKRLDAAKEELRYAKEGKYDVYVVNDDLKVAGEKLEKVAMGWEGWKTCGDTLPELNLAELD